MTLRLAALLAAALPLAACVSFGEKTPDQLMTLTATTPVTAGAAQAIEPAKAVQIAFPTVPQTLATLRVPVQASDTGIAYLKDARWAEPPNRLFRNLLAEVVAQRTGRAVLDPRQFSVSAGLRLTGGMKAFGLNAPASAVVVIYDAVLAREGSPLQSRRFEASVPVGALDAASVAPALNQAANQVAMEVSDWIGR
ncbi:MAG: transporter auxiliary component-like protein [Sphingomonas bacterium]|nr:ABC-type transport auxiliary lipoprotein family protein [Sphingomonas bacterium]MDB5689779.1 transporter auxiliary component-like protein [Sphingomonas bacterium]